MLSLTLRDFHDFYDLKELPSQLLLPIMYYLSYKRSPGPATKTLLVLRLAVVKFLCVLHKAYMKSVVRVGLGGMQDDTRASLMLYIKF